MDINHWPVFPEAHLEGNDWRRFRDEFERTKPATPEEPHDAHMRALRILQEGNYPEPPPRNARFIHQSVLAGKVKGQDLG